MALGRRDVERQSDFWKVTSELPQSPGHPFYEKLNELLRAMVRNHRLHSVLESVLATHPPQRTDCAPRTQTRSPTDRRLKSRILQRADRLYNLLIGEICQDSPLSEPAFVQLRYECDPSSEYTP